MAKEEIYSRTFSSQNRQKEGVETADSRELEKDYKEGVRGMRWGPAFKNKERLPKPSKH